MIIKPIRLQGFTLIEILVSMVILAIIGSMTIIALQTSIRAQNSISKKSELLSEVQAALMIIERDLLQFIDRPIAIDPQVMLSPIIIENSYDSFAISLTKAGHANPYAANNRSTLQRITYTWKNNTLYRDIWEVLDRAENNSYTRQPILKNVSSFTVTYLNTGNTFTSGSLNNNQIVIQKNSANAQQPYIIPKAIRLDLYVENIGKISRVIPLTGSN